MNNDTIKTISIILVVLAVIGGSIYSIVNSASSSSVSKTDVKDIVEEYIRKNPQTIVDALTRYQQDMQNEMQAKSQEAVGDHIDALENDEHSPFIGKADADKVLVEFFDYSCGYCKHALPSLLQIVKEHPDVKVVFKEFPILGEKSRLASRAALAVNKVDPEKYLDFHTAIMKGGISGKASLEKIATDLGINWPKVEKMMDSAEVNKILQQNKDLAHALSIRGTPAFVINGQLFPGAIGYDAMVEALNNEGDNS